MGKKEESVINAKTSRVFWSAVGLPIVAFSIAMAGMVSKTTEPEGRLLVLVLSILVLVLGQFGLSVWRNVDELSERIAAHKASGGASE